MSDNIYLGTEAREKLMSGINKAVEAVKKTYGAAGSNALIQAPEYPGHRISNDGIRIIEAIKLDDPIEQIGVNLVKENSTRSNSQSGDGSTTAAILLQAILQEGAKQKDISPMELKKQLEECMPMIEKAIDDQTKQITPDEVGKVATIAAESEFLGNTIQEIYKIIGKDGIIELEPSKTYDTVYEVGKGIKLRNAGFLAPYMANEGMRAVYTRPLILITKQKIQTIPEIDPILQQVSKSKSELVIFCEDVDMKVVQYFAKAHFEGIFKVLVIKAPTLWKDWLYEDFAKITGATIIDPTQGTTLKRFQLSQLGTCDKLIATRDETTILGIKDISDHLRSLEELAKDDNQIKLRIAWLNTAAATLKLGAKTEVELSHLMDKAEDARNSAYMALQGGVVKGGGTVFLFAEDSLPNTVGGNMLSRALQMPVRQICSNAGFPEMVLGKDDFSGNRGFDAKKKEFVDMWETGILDPAMTAKNAVRNAISVASIVLTADTVITLPKP